jgi:hypothetical protein
MSFVEQMVATPKYLIISIFYPSAGFFFMGAV